MSGEKDQVEELAEKVAKDLDADVIFFAGPLDWPVDDTFIIKSLEWQRRKNVLLLFTTFGGSPDVAYRIARCLGRRYRNGKTIVFVDTDCTSAGTLLAVGADELVLSDLAQLGPLDVQRWKPGEVGERTSGLVASKALVVLEELSHQYFWESFRNLRFHRRLPTGLAAEVAQKLTIGVFGSIYSQIEPMDLGENQRALDISRQYGERLANENLKPQALSRLIAAYPSHRFVIDREEASELFKAVRPPTGDESRLATMLRERALSALRRDKPEVELLSKLTEEVPDAKELRTTGAEDSAPRSEEKRGTGSDSPSADDEGVSAGEDVVRADAGRG